MRVAIVSEVRFYREALGAALAQHGIDIVAAASDHATIIDDVVRLLPDIVLVDASVPDTLEAARALAAAAPAARMVAVSVAEADAEILACAEAGAAGYVPRECSIEDLAERLRRTLRGEVVCSPSVAASLFRRIRELSACPSVAEQRLTVREREILGLMNQGLSNREIAARLWIQVSTVKNHVHNILGKLEVGQRGIAAAQVAERRPSGRPRFPVRYGEKVGATS